MNKINLNIYDKELLQVDRNKSSNTNMKNKDGFDNYILTKRVKNKSITKYLNHVLDDLQDLEYLVDEEFQAQELIDTLDTDLPSSDLLGREYFIKDVANITNHYFQQSQTRSVIVKIEIVTGDMCRIFHADHILQRLICTYLGHGTEWIDETNTNRPGLGSGDNNQIVRDFDQIKRTCEFDILIMRGQKYPGLLNKGLVHRSPSIEAKNETRVILKIDENL